MAAEILIVDDDADVREFLAGVLAGEGHTVRECGGPAEALRALAEHSFDLVLSDFHMPGGTGLQLLRAMNERECPAVFLMITGVDDARTAVEALKDGAADYLVKPLKLEQVREAVRSGLEKRDRRRAVERERAEIEQLLTRQTAQLEQASLQTLLALSSTLDLRARDVAGHSERVSRYSAELARALGYSETERSRLQRAALLHDIGKIGIPDAILHKPGSLTAEETAIMRGHVEIGFELVKRVPLLAEAAELVLAHQECFDGRGYPRGLRGAEIPLDARIFAVADAYDAMTSDRSYRKAMSVEAARAEIALQSGRQFDPQVVEAFLRTPLAATAA